MKQNPLQERIIIDPNIQHGRPCIKGTRTPIYVILESLAMGMNFEEIKRQYHPITEDDIKACIWYAAMLADEQELIPQTTN